MIQPDPLHVYNLEKIKQGFYFTEEGRQNAIKHALEWNKKVKNGIVNNDSNYIGYVFGILSYYILNDKMITPEKAREIHHQYCIGHYSMVTETFRDLKTKGILDSEVVNEIEEALFHVKFKYDKLYERNEIEYRWYYEDLGYKWIKEHLKN